MTKTACMSDSTKALKRLAFALVFLGSFFSCFAQLDTAFWYAVPHITHDHAGRPIKLCVSTLGQPATITVRKPAAGNALVGTFTVPANSSQSYQIVGGSQSDLSNITQFECNHNTTSNYGLYIHSTAKVNAYIAVQNNNSEIYALKGGNALGTQFFIPMQYQYTNATNYSDARNSVEVIATENNTSVTITPSVALYGGTHPAHVPFTITLNKGQVYSFASSSQSGANHLCGTVITSNKPIAVDVSDDSATPNGSNQDLVADQLVPEDRAELFVHLFAVPAEVCDIVRLVLSLPGQDPPADGSGVPALDLVDVPAVAPDLEDPGSLHLPGFLRRYGELRGAHGLHLHATAPHLRGQHQAQRFRQGTVILRRHFPGQGHQLRRDGRVILQRADHGAQLLRRHVAFRRHFGHDAFLFAGAERDGHPLPGAQRHALRNQVGKRLCHILMNDVHDHPAIHPFPSFPGTKNHFLL